jgi:hypothetical protein
MKIPHLHMKISEAIEGISIELDQKAVKRIKMLQNKEGGCDDFNDRIDQIFKKLDDHLSVLDGLLISV